MTLAASSFSGGDYFGVIMRVGRTPGARSGVGRGFVARYRNLSYCIVAVLVAGN